MLPRAFTVALLLLAAAVAPGCNAVTTAGDIVGSTFDVASEVVRAGKADTFVAANEQTVIIAVQQTAARLEIKLAKDEPLPKNRRKFTYRDDREQKIIVTVVRRAAIGRAESGGILSDGSGGMGSTVLVIGSTKLPCVPTGARASC